MVDQMGAKWLEAAMNGICDLPNLVHAPAYQEVRQNLKNEMLHRVMLQDFPLPPRDLLVIGAALGSWQDPFRA